MGGTGAPGPTVTQVTRRRPYDLSWMGTFVERELKLELDEGFTFPELPGEPLESRLFTSTYHDTPDRSLAGAGITLRRRVENGLSRWQLKLPRGGNARAELEAPGGPVGPPAPLADAPRRARPPRTVGPGRDAAHAPDRGARRRQRPDDRRRDTRLGRRARRRADRPARSPRSRSSSSTAKTTTSSASGRTLRKAGAKKSEGTPKLLRVLPPPPRPQAEEGASAVELLHVLLAEQLRELLRHDPGVRLGDDAEDIHQFRVATRRSRALIRATEPMLGDRLTRARR